MGLNIITRKDYEDLQKNILNEKEKVNMAFPRSQGPRWECI